MSTSFIHSNVLLEMLNVGGWICRNEPVSKYHVDIVVRSQEKFLREFAGA